MAVVGAAVGTVAVGTGRHCGGVEGSAAPARTQAAHHLPALVEEGVRTALVLVTAAAAVAEVDAVVTAAAAVACNATVAAGHRTAAVP